MQPYISTPTQSITVDGVSIAVFNTNTHNIDHATVKSFGEEWNKFDSFDEKEINQIGNEYFDIVTSKMLNKESVVLDMGCGSGRWSQYVAQRAKFVECIDPSDAVIAASKLLNQVSNKRITQAGVDEIPFADNSFDFVFSLGVLHHIPDTKSAMKACVKKVKPGGYFLVYLYYSLDNRGALYKLIFKTSNIFRVLISKLPSAFKKAVCDFIAVTVYMPFVFAARLLNALSFQKIAQKLPLYYYFDKTFNVIRNDALDRFGTPLEQRFSKNEIRSMMEESGLTEIVFSTQSPFWHAVGRKEQA